VDRVDGDTALTSTAEGVELLVPADGRKVGESLTAILRPADFTLAAHGIPGTVNRAVYLGSDLHLSVTPEAGGPNIVVTIRDGLGVGEGTRLHLAHDPAHVHVLEGG